MKLRDKLFGKASEQNQAPRRPMSPLLQAMAAEIPRWPARDQRVLEKIVIEASAAGVSSMEDFSEFLDSHPDLSAGYSRAMGGALGPQGSEMLSAIEQLEQLEQLEREPVSQTTIKKLGGDDVDISSPEDMQAYMEAHPEKVIELSTLMLENARTRGDRLSESTVVGEMGLAYARMNQLPKAIHYFERHLELARELGNWQWEMEDYRNLGRAHFELGENERARTIYEDALRLAQEQGDRQWIINHSYSLASVCSALGDLERTVELTNSANALSKKAGR